MTKTMWMLALFLSVGLGWGITSITYQGATLMQYQEYDKDFQQFFEDVHVIAESEKQEMERSE